MSTRLEQRHGLFARRSYAIVDNEVVIENRRLGSGDTARYPIFDLSDTTDRYFTRAWRYLAGALALAAFSIPFVIDAVQLRTGFPLAGAALCWIGAALCALGYVSKSYDQIVFNHWQTGKGVFVVWNNKPNRAEFERFMEALVGKIRSLRVNPRATPAQRMEIYGRHLSFLVQEGVLTGDEARGFYARKEQALERDKANVIALVPGATS